MSPIRIRLSRSGEYTLQANGRDGGRTMRLRALPFPCASTIGVAIFSVLILVSTTRAVAGAEVGLVLVADGEPQCAIVVGQSPSKAAKDAAEELRQTLKGMTGAEIPVKREGEPFEGIAQPTLILIGDSELAIQTGVKGNDLAPE